MNKPLVSVIVPVFNLQDYLEKSLASLWKQTFQDFEVICINDGSTDNSLKLLQDIAQNHPNMTVFDKPNGGVSSARNMGLNAAQGDYIYFLDADDIMHPQMLQIMVENIALYEADVIDCDYIKIAAQEDAKFFDYQDVQSCVYENPLKCFLQREKVFLYSSCTKLYKHSCLKNLNLHKKIHYGEDLLLNLEIFSKIGKAVKISLPLYFYVERPTSCVNSAFNDKKAKSFINLINEIYEKFHSHPEYPLIKKNILILSAKFLIKKIYNMPTAPKYVPDLWKLYKLGTFNLLSLGCKNCFRAVLLFVRWRLSL